MLWDKTRLKNKFKGSSQVATSSQIKYLVTTLFMSAICKDVWFVDFGVS